MRIKNGKQYLYFEIHPPKQAPPSFLSFGAVFSSQKEPEVELTKLLY